MVPTTAGVAARRGRANNSWWQQHRNSIAASHASSVAHDGNSAQLAADKHPSGGAQPVAAAASTHVAESSNARKALQTLYDTLRSTLVSAVESEENNVSRPAAIRRLESVNHHLQDFDEEEIT